MRRFEALAALVRGRVWLLAILALALIKFAAISGASAEEAQLALKAEAAILMDAETGAVLYQKKADQLMPPASMSKLMTLTLLFKALKAGQIQLTDEFVMSDHAWRTGGAVRPGSSAMMVPLNTRATIQDLALGVIVQSGNDAAIAIAEGLAGSEGEFAHQMEAEGRRIGLKVSTFRNATGLPDPDQLMTAREIALLAQHIIKTYPEFYPLFSTREFTYVEHRLGSLEPKTHKFINRNPLLFMNMGVDGLKTGSLKESGYGIVASAVQGDRRLIAVINGAPTSNDRMEEARKLIEWGERTFTNFRLYDPDEAVSDVRVWGGVQFYVPVTGAKGKSVSVVLPRTSANQKLATELVYTSPIRAPVKAGDQVAKLRVTLAGAPAGAVNEIPLYAASDVPEGPTWRKGLDTLALLAFSLPGRLLSK